MTIRLDEVVFRRLQREDGWEILVKGATAQITVSRNERGDAQDYTYAFIAFSSDITPSELSDVIHRAILAGMIE